MKVPGSNATSPEWPRAQHPGGGTQLPGCDEQRPGDPAQRDVHRVYPAGAAGWLWRPSRAGVGIVLADLARELDLGIGCLVSLGNKVDVSGNDLLASWTDDPAVSAAALYLESFGNARKFARIARTIRRAQAADGRGRAVGRTVVGVPGASHTAAAATPAVGVAALFAQAGVIACDDADDLAETALLLTREPLPWGPASAW